MELESKIKELENELKILSFLRDFDISKLKDQNFLIAENIEYLENQLSNINNKRLSSINLSKDKNITSKERAMHRDTEKVMQGFDLGVKFAISLFLYGSKENLSEWVDENYTTNQ